MKVPLREAEAEWQEVQSWTCRSCNIMVEGEGPYCRSCAAYWADVSNGMFDEPQTPGDGDE